MPRNLRYVGEGAYVVGVPAQDLKDISDDLATELIDSGLYEASEDDPQAPAEEAN